MARKKITDDTFFNSITINRQLLTEENAKHMFPFLGKTIVHYIKEHRLIIPEGDFIVYIHVKFIEEKKYEETRKLFEGEEKGEVNK